MGPKKHLQFSVEWDQWAFAVVLSGGRKGFGFIVAIGPFSMMLES